MSDSPVGGGVTGPDPRELTVYEHPSDIVGLPLRRLDPLPGWTPVEYVPKGSEWARVIEELREKADEAAVEAHVRGAWVQGLRLAADWLARGLDGESE